MQDYVFAMILERPIARESLIKRETGGTSVMKGAMQPYLFVKLHNSTVKIDNVMKVRLLMTSLPEKEATSYFN
jgi:hypothetical protein